MNMGLLHWFSESANRANISNGLGPVARKYNICLRRKVHTVLLHLHSKYPNKTHPSDGNDVLLSQSCVPHLNN